MTEETRIGLEIASIIMAIIGYCYGFYKLITKGAEREADLRNEIKNLKADQLEMSELLKNMTTKFELVTTKLQNVEYLEKRTSSIERMNEKIGEKMDKFSEQLNTIRLMLERKLDRQ